MAQRIHILGGPGSGKSTLARRLAAERKLPLFELDALFWDNESPAYDARRASAERDRLLQQQVQTEAWIIEGVYWSWCLPSFERADEIWILQTPRWKRHWRLGLRFIKRKLNIEKSLKKDSFRGYWEMAKWNARWDRDNGAQAQKLLQAYEKKIKWLKPGFPPLDSN